MDKAAALILRTVLEDRELHRRLDGYANDAQRVGHRLVRENSRSRAFPMAISVKA
jgi:hypothetical protein